MNVRLRNSLIILMVFTLLASCAPRVQTMDLAPMDPDVTGEALAERDEIYMLAAYAVVLNDWQDGSGKKRGHNIGSILVDPNGKIVNWGRNCNSALSNGTQHGEVRNMVGYLNRVGGYSLKGHTIYTSLEPCAQCSGMMVLTSIERTVYGQTDPGFGKAMERLSLDSKQWSPDGYEPYPREVISDRSDTPYCKQLEDAYEEAGGSITRFLLTDQAKAIFEAATEKLMTYELKYPDQNTGLLKHVQGSVALVKPGIPTINIKPK